MTAVVAVVFVLLAVTAFLCLLRVLLGPSVPDRIVALDVLLVVLVSGVALDAARTGSGVNLNLLLVVSLLSFVGTVAVARYVERRGDRSP
jgi:multicomponent Na+:H+ antiporter subunit F